MTENNDTHRPVDMDALRARIWAARAAAEVGERPQFRPLRALAVKRAVNHLDIKIAKVTEELENTENLQAQMPNSQMFERNRMDLMAELLDLQRARALELDWLKVNEPKEISSADVAAWTSFNAAIAVIAAQQRWGYRKQFLVYVAANQLRTLAMNPKQIWAEIEYVNGVFARLKATIREHRAGLSEG